MWIKEPEAIQQILVERPLEPENNEILKRAMRAIGDKDTKVDVSEVLRSMPVMAIGKPEFWILKDFNTSQQLVHSLQTKTKKANFYVVQFSCSFRPFHQESRIEWARFGVTLLPDTTTGEQPVAYDLYPQRIVQEEKRQTKITLSPLLKFQELEVSPGSMEFTIERTEQHPLVSAAIMDGYTPSWDYTETPGHKLQGTKWMYLLIEAHKGLPTGRARLNLWADVVVRGIRFPAVFWHQKKQTEEQQTVQLWK